MIDDDCIYGDHCNPNYNKMNETMRSGNSKIYEDSDSSTFRLINFVSGNQHRKSQTNRVQVENTDATEDDAAAKPIDFYQMMNQTEESSQFN